MLFLKKCRCTLWRRRIKYWEFFKLSLTMIECETRKKLKCLCSDNGGKYTYREFDAYCSKHDIRHENIVCALQKEWTRRSWTRSEVWSIWVFCQSHYGEKLFVSPALGCFFSCIQGAQVETWHKVSSMNFYRIWRWKIRIQTVGFKG